MIKEKEPPFGLKICDWIVKYSLYALIFLMPIFFFPWTAEILDFNKQTLLILLVFIALFSWMLKALISGKFEVSKSKIHIAVGVLFLAYLLAAVFSANKYGSFWGWPQITSESLLSLIGLAAFYFLVSNTFSKEDIFKSLAIFSFSALIAKLVGIFQLFGLFISFNTIGSVGSLGFFAAILLPLETAMLIASKKWWKILFVLQLVLSFLILFLINYHIVWWAVAIGSVSLMVFGIIKRDFFDGRWMAFPMFFLALSLFFMLLNPQLPAVSQRINEIFLSQRISLDISLKTIKENPVFGSGPGTFSYDFLKFKNTDLSQGILQNVVFNQASSKVLTDLAATGIVGFLALLVFIFLPVFFGAKFLVSQGPKGYPEKNPFVLALGLFGGLTACGLMYFLYNPSIALNFIFFFITAGLVCLTSASKRKYELNSSSLLTLIITFVFTLAFIFGLGLIILGGQRYVAEVSYYKGLVYLQGEKIDEGIKSLETAAAMNPGSDIYFSQLSRVYLLKLRQELQKSADISAMSDEEKNKMQTLVANSINAAKLATDLNPKSGANWSLRADTYRNLLGITNDAGTWALNSYDEALKLNPNSPYLFAQKGNVFLAVASGLAEDKQQEKNQALSQAEEQLKKSLGLNPNYSDGLYFLGLVYKAMGEKSKAIEQFEKVRQLNPQNKDIQENIQKILDELKNV